MGTLKELKYEGGVVARDSQEAVEMLYSKEYKHVVLYSSQREKLVQMCEEVYKEVRKRNSQIQDKSQQMLPTEPYFWDDINGCLAVKCAEISINVFSEASKRLYVFTRPRYNCLVS